MTIIEQIKAEIDKLYGEYKNKFHQCGDQYHLGLIDGIDMVERVLDTLESEKPIIPNDLAGARHEDEQLSEKIAAAYQLGLADKEKQMMSKAVEGWVAADSDTYGKRRVTFFPKKPVRDVLTEYKYWAATRPTYESIKLDSNAFPNLKWEDEPKKVKLIIVKED